LELKVKTKVILRTEHGSHLYGLAGPQSDYDYYEIYEFLNKRYRPRKQAAQNINDDQDVVALSVDRFESLCLKGVPQAVEVLFSPPEAWVHVEEGWHGIANHIKEQLPNHMPTILDTYRRTALNFHKGDAKQQRHAFRLVLNAKELQHGAMHARLTPDQIALVNSYTNAFDSDAKFKDLVYDTF
jgi:predicted nucleotidyltransferase